MQKALLLISLQDCTEGEESRGWLHLGHAIRLSQVLRLGSEDDPSDPSEALAAHVNGISASHNPNLRTPIESEARRRTYWSCFLAERLLCSGRDRPCALIAHANTYPRQVSIRFPSSDVDFLAGMKNPDAAHFDGPPPPWARSSRESDVPEQEADLIGQTYRVADIWSQVVSYVGSGGRNIDRRPPWSSESTFYRLDTRLRSWEESLPPHFRYSEANLLAHVMLPGGQGRLFGLLHLLYFSESHLVWAYLSLLIVSSSLATLSTPRLYSLHTSSILHAL
jgi:hypothetical protein